MKIITASLQKSMLQPVLFMRTWKEQGQKSAEETPGWRWQDGPERLYVAHTWYFILLYIQFFPFQILEYSTGICLHHYMQELLWSNNISTRSFKYENHCLWVYNLISPEEIQSTQDFFNLQAHLMPKSTC